MTTAAQYNRIQKEIAGYINNQIAHPMAGIVSSYDPKRGAAKVQIMPETVDEETGEVAETGWIPIHYPVTGDGWGIYAPPSPGDQVLIIHQEHEHGSAIIMGRLNDEDHKHPAVPSGEFWIVHQKSGSLLKFFNDGHVELGANTDLTVNVPDGTTTVNTKNAVVNTTESTTVNAQKDIAATAQGNLNGTAHGNATVHADGSLTASAGGSATVSGSSVSIQSGNVRLGGSGGRRIALDGDPVVQSRVVATSATTFST